MSGYNLRYRGFAACLALGSLMLLANAAQAVEVDVTPGNLNGWTPQISGTSSLDFVNGPLLPPCGTGSLELSVGPNGAGAAQLRNKDYAGVALSDLTSLGYSTFVQQDGSGGQAPYIILHVDYDNNGTSDDLLFFEPIYQSAVFFPSNPQAPLVVGAWQSWDALNGGWWSVNGTAGAGPGTDVKSLDDILAAEPDATIVNTGTGLGGVRLVAGFGAGAWDDFVGNADCFTLGIDGDEVTYDFEADDDEDGVPNELDECPDSDLRPFVNVGTGNTSIPNAVNEEGCSIQDLVHHCEDTAKNHGQYVSCITKLANDLYDAGVITKSQRQEMKTGAAKSNIGK